MSNIISLNQYAEASQPGHVKTTPRSPLDFVAYERPLWYEGREGTKYNNTAHKALVRMLDDKPVCLNIVGEGYKVVQNSELFALVEQQMHEALGRDADNAVVKDEIAYGGADCLRTYRFPNINVPTPENNLIHFKVTVRNGFGSGSIRIMSGGEDQICTNGMVRFSGDATYAKHTKGLTLQRFDKIVSRSIDIFWKQRDLYKELQKMTVSDDKVFTFLKEYFGDSLGHKLYHQYNIERLSRGGRNLWALHSALTHYASHSDGDFSLRATGNDHNAATMLKRQLVVAKVIDAPEFMRIAA